jgi:hypothetical protein
MRAPHPPAVGISIGESKGQTVLPLPATDTPQLSDQDAQDKASIRVLERAVVLWTKQIKGVLKADPDAALKVCVCAQRADTRPSATGQAAGLWALTC